MPCDKPENKHVVAAKEVQDLACVFYKKPTDETQTGMKDEVKKDKQTGFVPFHVIEKSSNETAGS